MIRVSAAVLVGALVGCPQSKGDGATAASASAFTSTSSAPNGAGQHSSRSTAASKWTGTYESAAGSFYVPDAADWAIVKWRGEDAGTGIGAGTIALTVDTAAGRVTGSCDGAIGDVLLAGVLVGDEVTANVTRKDPSDHGLTGTTVAKLAGDTIQGTMRLSPSDGRILREAKFSLSREKP